MSEFMVMLKGNMKDWNAQSAEESQEIMERYGQWVQRLKDENRFKTGAALKDGSWSISIRQDQLVVDGPFTEAKETLTGYFIIEAEGSEQAIEIAKGCPALTHGEKVEVFELSH